jgi:CIC family chloride channel protein
MTGVAARLLAARLADLRARVRSNVLMQVGVAIVVGALAGICVIAMSKITERAHIWIYGLAFDERLSARAEVSPIAALAGLCLGGLVLGLMDRWRRARKSEPTVDPIEANALHGGKLSVRDGLVVVAQTLISNGCGASVGLEAGYAQIGSALASRTGLFLRLRRQDLRTLVGCGAAGAIAAAFAAPLTGAFYAFELIVGAYSLSNAGPIIAASLSATLTVKGLGGAPYLVSAPPAAVLTIGDHLALIVLGLVSAGVGVGAMRAAALVERSFQASPLPTWARPVVGGFILAAFAMYTPQVLGAGHGALELDTPRSLSAATLVALIALKLTACLVSLASGFRGGLFFASIFVGALLGKLFALAAATFVPTLGLDPTACLFAGMGTLGVAIVGGPLTMTFLVLESSGDLSVAGGVLAACIATSVTVRATFGYSFSTWRLHLRGETILGAQDVGWIRDLTVARLMDRDPRMIAANATLREFRNAHPLGSASVVALREGDGSYGGLVSAPEAHAPAHDLDQDALPISIFARLRQTSLHPDQNIKTAMAMFASARSDILAVTDPETGEVLGLLGEALAARRYAEETERAAKGVFGGG